MGVPDTLSGATRHNGFCKLLAEDTRHMVTNLDLVFPEEVRDPLSRNFEDEVPVMADPLVLVDRLEVGGCTSRYIRSGSHTCVPFAHIAHITHISPIVHIVPPIAHTAYIVPTAHIVPIAHIDPITHIAHIVDLFVLVMLELL